MAKTNGNWLVVASSELAAEIDPLGAQLCSLRDRDGRDLQWGGEPEVWAGRAPLLFPIVGELAGGRYRLGTDTYPLPRHGFARRRVFELLGAGANAVQLRLSADEATLAVYPFQFDLDVAFTVVDATLTTTVTVRNRGGSDLPASFGFHPAFRWPLPYGADRAAHFIEFARDEPAPVRRLDAHGLLRAETLPTPVVERRLPLRDELFAHDVLIFEALNSNSLTYGAERSPRLRVTFPDTPFLGLWTKPGAGFICIEPWHGIADPIGYAGDFRSKPGIFMLAPGTAKTLVMTATLVPGG